MKSYFCDNKINPFFIKSSIDKLSISRCSKAFSISFLEYPKTIKPEIASLIFSLLSLSFLEESLSFSSSCSSFSLSFNSRIILWADLFPIPGTFVRT